MKGVALSVAGAAVVLLAFAGGANAAGSLIRVTAPSVDKCWVPDIVVPEPVPEPEATPSPEVVLEPTPTPAPVFEPEPVPSPSLSTDPSPVEPSPTSEPTQSEATDAPLPE